MQETETCIGRTYVFSREMNRTRDPGKDAGHEDEVEWHGDDLKSMPLQISSTLRETE